METRTLCSLESYETSELQEEIYLPRLLVVK